MSFIAAMPTTRIAVDRVSLAMIDTVGSKVVPSERLWLRALMLVVSRTIVHTAGVRM